MTKKKKRQSRVADRIIVHEPKRENPQKSRAAAVQCDLPTCGFLTLGRVGSKCPFCGKGKMAYDKTVNQG